MTAAFLQSALTGLINDSKKKSNDVRSAAEKSLADLRSISVTSETQLARDLSRRSDFIAPFVLACHSKNAKLALPGAACLQRLVASQSVAREGLGDVLSACWEAVDLSYEVQLKVLQTLPALLQLYGKYIHDQLLARVLDICARLSVCRTPLVAKSAGATLDQLVDSVFEQAEVALRSTSKNGAKDRAKSAEPYNAQADSFAFVDDACRLFNDFCVLLNHGQPSFLRITSLSTLYLLGVLEKILENHRGLLRSNKALVEACRTQLLPAIQQTLTGTDDFVIVARSTHFTYVLLQELSDYLVQDAVPVLELFLAFADRDRGPLWKRCLALELFRSLLTNFGLLMRIFGSAQEIRNNVITNLMAALVRISSEEPTLIGIGRQSTMPAQRGADSREDEMASIEAQAVGGGGLASVSSADASATGLGLEFSTMERPLIDAEDSVGEPNVPRTYIYTLILESISSLCDGLSKFVMPLSVTSRQSDPQPDSEDDETDDGASEQAAAPEARKKDAFRHKYQRLANPLKMSRLPQLAQVKMCARMVEQCWPPILATSSTFLNAALDSHFYHILIRSMQKLAQVSGTLELSTPRDALLTSLAKGSVPANAASIIAISQRTRNLSGDGADETVGEGLKSPGTDGQRQSVDFQKQSLNVRHLLCLRALLNLGIALGPTLGQEAWFILIETLQQVEALMSISRSNTSGLAATYDLDGPQSGLPNLGNEMTAVTTAARRMFDSTRGYSDETFAELIIALFRLVGDMPSTTTPIEMTNVQPASPKALDSPITPRGHRTARSVSGLGAKIQGLDVELIFVLAKIKDLSRINLHRFGFSQAWDTIAFRLLDVSRNERLTDELRLEAAGILDLICMEAVKLEGGGSFAQSQSLSALNAQLKPLINRAVSSRPQQLQIQIGQRVLEALEDILGHCGESLEEWSSVFAILKAGQHHGIAGGAFRCVQLICNDFLQTLSPPSLDSLVSLMAYFSSQQDTNMALTTASLLRSMAALLQGQVDHIDIVLRNEQERAVSLWFSTIQQLTRLCEDARGDVRDASVRTLVQTTDGSSDLLTSQSWKALLEEPFILLIRHCLQEMQTADASSWEDTCIYLTEAMTRLIKDHISTIADGPGFHGMWKQLLDVFEAEIKVSNLRMYVTGFDAIGVLLESIYALNIDHEPLASTALVLWAKLTAPMSNEHPESSESNQAALASHASLLIHAHTASPGAVHSFNWKDDSIDVQLRNLIQRSLLTSRHMPYSSDVRKMSSEQEILLECIGILQEVMKDDLPEFVNFVLALLESMHGKNAAINELPSSPRKWQKPTFMAFSASILMVLCRLIEDDTSNIAHFDQARALRSLSSIIAFKYTAIPVNPEAPLWKQATATATVLLEASQATRIPNEVPLVVESMIGLFSSVLGSGGLPEAKASHSAESLAADEDFDIANFTRILAASAHLVRLASVPIHVRNCYVLTVFHASTLAKPWFNDFPQDLINEPLKDINTLRRGSVHDPAFPLRQKIVYAALDALFDLVSPAASTPMYALTLARTAFPYLLLRIAHPIRVFLADHPLRGLTPFPKPQQVELHTILKKCLDLRCDDNAFAVARAEARREPSSTNSGPDEARKTGPGERLPSDAADTSDIESETSSSAVMAGGRPGDGKSHLRALYKMILRLQKGWNGTMRLDNGMAWQDDVEGRGIEECMERWIEVVSEEWSI